MKKLSVAILSKLESPTITKELQPELEKRGHNVDVIDLSAVCINDFTDQPAVQSLCSYDIVYYRSGLAIDTIILLESYLKTCNNVVMVNSHFTKHPFANSKTYETITANKNGLTVPNSLFNCGSDFETIVNTVGSPFVIKTNDGARGENVHLINNAREHEAIVNNATGLKYLYQSFVPHISEYRVHAIGGEVVAMYRRTPSKGDFRSNVSLGGSMHSVEERYVEPLTALAKVAARLFNFEIIAIDFMLHSETGEFYFTEINLNAGWEISDESATGVDLTFKTVDYS